MVRSTFATLHGDIFLSRARAHRGPGRGRDEEMKYTDTHLYIGKSGKIWTKGLTWFYGLKSEYEILIIIGGDSDGELTRNERYVLGNWLKEYYVRVDK